MQVVIALIVTPEGFPLAYEVLPGNTADNTTLGDPTEHTLQQMRASDPPVQYLVGTPKGRLSKLESELASPPTVGRRTRSRSASSRASTTRSG